MKQHNEEQKRALKTAAGSLYKAFLTLKTADEVRQFLLDLCTPSEVEAIVDREKSDSVLAAIAKLEHSQRMIIHLYYWQGFKIREVAEILDCPEGTIKVYLLRAREKLSSLLERMKS